MTTPTLTGPLCECGCGEYLPVGSTRKYKRGHKERVNQALADQMQSNGVFDGYNFRFEPTYNSEPINPDGFITIPDESGWETIQQAADNVPNDPEGNLWDKSPEFEYKLTLPKTVQKDIEGKLAFMLTTTGMAIGLPDPICGNAILENTPNIAKALTPIICQSPGVVAWFSKTSNIMLYVNLAMAVAPVVMTVLNHHIPNRNPKIEDPMNGQMNIPVDPNYYGVR